MEQSNKLSSWWVLNVIVLIVIGLVYGFIIVLPRLLEKRLVTTFLESLPENKIDLVAVFAFGVSQTDIDAVAKMITDEIGVEVGIRSDPSMTEFKKIEGLYDFEREQYNADAIWGLTDFKLKSHGLTKRAVMLVDFDIYSSIQAERPYILSREFPNTNTVLISLYRLRMMSDVSDKQAPEDLFLQRLKKVVVRSLVTSAGAGSSPAAKRIACIMYPADTLLELDKKGDVLCSPTKKALSRIFEIK